MTFLVLLMGGGGARQRGTQRDFASPGTPLNYIMTLFLMNLHVHHRRNNQGNHCICIYTRAVSYCICMEPVALEIPGLESKLSFCYVW